MRQKLISFPLFIIESDFQQGGKHAALIIPFTSRLQTVEWISLGLFQVSGRIRCANLRTWTLVKGLSGLRGTDEQQLTLNTAPTITEMF